MPGVPARTPDRLVVRPGTLRGSFRPAGDKSITHRAILFALLARGRSRIVGANRGADCRATLDCARALGGAAVDDGGEIVVDGIGEELREPEGILECGNSGTTLRLLAGVVAARPVLAVLAGDASLHRRPVDRILGPLRRMGAEVAARAGDRLPPLVVRGGALAAIEERLSVASAQVATCIVLAALRAAGTTRIEIPGPARDHTERLLPQFGVELECAGRAGGGRRVAVHGPAALAAADVCVPGDPSAAAFLLAAAAATPGARVTAEGVGLNPTRSGLLDALERMGAIVERRPRGVAAGEPVGEVTVEGPERLRGTDVEPAALPAMIDDVPAWAVAAACADGASRVAGAGELRVKESDRLAAIARLLDGAGIAVAADGDRLVITGGRPAGVRFDAGGDHRMAMAAAVLGLVASGPARVAGSGCIATSDPGFVATLRALGAAVEEPEAR